MLCVLLSQGHSQPEPRALLRGAGGWALLQAWSRLLLLRVKVQVRGCVTDSLTSLYCCSMDPQSVTFKHLKPVSQTLTPQPQKHRRPSAGQGAWGLIGCFLFCFLKILSRGLWPPRDDHSYIMAENWPQKDSSLVNCPTVTLGRTRFQMTISK